MGTPRTKIALALLAAWLGWGFDVFDAHLFNYVAKPTLKTLLHSPTETEINAHLAWLTSLFLVGWGVGGVVFGKLTDRLGRSRVLLVTMLLYGGGTAACSLVSTLPAFVACRIVASLGIGGEWAAGASLLAEIAPDRFRPLLGALMYTASPIAQLVASAVCHRIVEGRYADQPDRGWRVAFLLGLAPALVAFALRAFVAEPARWKEEKRHDGKLEELFTPERRRGTLAGMTLASLALVGAWGVLGFMPKAIREWCEAAHLTNETLAATVHAGNTWVLAGGLLGTLATVPAAVLLGRRGAFALWFLGAAVAITVALDGGLPLEQRLPALLSVGFFAHGIFGIFPYYLPELFPTCLRGTGSGFSYSVGRFLSAAGVFFVGDLQRTLGLTRAMLFVACVYPVGLLVTPFARETRNEKL